ncbi:MAG: hypothetical protein H6993_08830 [Pseudomonadales bacterium]|nr:hypothetical protein [Pseudomonadales bacterium]MCP5184052.1 hypothetical protein [Pseudomonadales bacterium]
MKSGTAAIRNDLSHAIGLLANIGVIAGIAFLAIELRQNSEAVLKRRNGDELTDYEALVLNRSMAMTLLNYQYVFSEFQRGRISEAELPIASWRQDLDGKETVSGHQYWPDLREYWVNNDYREFDPAFVAWMNANIVDVREQTRQ